MKAEIPAANPPELAQPSRPETSVRPAAAERLLSLDAYRGAIMLLMAAETLAIMLPFFGHNIAAILAIVAPPLAF